MQPTTPLDEIAGHVHKFYPGAHPMNTQMSYLLNIITQQYGVERGRIMYAQSVCADDVNAIKFPPVMRPILGPFSMGGLDGYPFVGKAGVNAYAHHVPAEGAAFIFCGPHVGVSNGGELGKILRHGQNKEGGACGAALGVLGWLRGGGELPTNVPPDDQQLYLLMEFAKRHRDEILVDGSSQEEQLYAFTEALYAEIWKKVVAYVTDAANVTFDCKHVFVAGGVMINTSWMFDDYLSLRNFEVYDGQTRQLVKRFDQLAPERVNS